MDRICFLGVDQGSSSTKAALLDSSGAFVSGFSVPVGTTRNDSVFIEQDPEAPARVCARSYL